MNPITFKERQKINHALNENGLASMENPRELLSQIAFLIRNHEQFRSILLTVTPDKRTECYEALKPRLSFEAKPLADYIIEGAQDAEAQRLPVMGEDGKMVSFENYHRGPKSLHEMAEEAIARKEREDTAKGSLELVCRRCTFAEIFPAKSKVQAYKDAHMKGWTFEIVKDKEKALCPKCSSPIIH